MSINTATHIDNNAFYGCRDLSELHINMPISYVYNNSRQWGLGIDDLGDPSMVIVRCSDGILIINDGGQDDSRP